MESSQELWRNYHSAMQSGKIDLAKRILSQLKNRTMTAAPSVGPKKSRGCAKCQRRFY